MTIDVDEVDTAGTALMSPARLIWVGEGTQKKVFVAMLETQDVRYHHASIDVRTGREGTTSQLEERGS